MNAPFHCCVNAPRIGLEDVAEKRVQGRGQDGVRAGALVELPLDETSVQVREWLFDLVHQPMMWG